MLGPLSLVLFTVTVGAPAPPPPQGHIHDGMQFRATVGGGYLGTTFAGNRLSGGAVDFEFFLGGSLIPGLTVGAVLGGAIASSPTLYAGGTSGNLPGDTKLALGVVGGYVDYYVVPTAGFHVLVDVAYSRLTLDVNNGSGSDDGWGVGAGAGYDWWVSTNWSVGVLARFNYAKASDEIFSYDIVSPGLVVSFAYH